MHGFTAKEVMRLSNLTYRQLDYWARTDFIYPSITKQSGNRTMRQYTFTDVLAIRAAMKLLSAGIPLQRLRKAVNRLQKELNEKNEALYRLVWLTDGENLFILDDRNHIREALTGQYVLTFTVDLGQIARDLQKDVDYMQQREKEGKYRHYQIPDLAAKNM